MRDLFLPCSFLLGTLVLTQPNFLLAQENNPNPNQIVQTETCWQYPIKENTASKDGYVSIQTTYNEQGQKTKMINYKADRTIAYEYFFDYQNQSRICYWNTLDGTQINSEVEQYNEKGQIVTRTRYSTNGEVLDVQNFDYKKGKLNKESYYNDQAQVIYGIEYSYNEGQNTIRETYTNYENNEQTIGAIELDAYALPSLYTEYEMSGPIVRKITYERDEKGRVLAKKTYLAGEILDSKEVYKYTSNTTECSTYINGGKQLVEYAVYKYTYHKKIK